MERLNCQRGDRYQTERQRPGDHGEGARGENRCAGSGAIHPVLAWCPCWHSVGGMTACHLARVVGLVVQAPRRFGSWTWTADAGTFQNPCEEAGAVCSPTSRLASGGIACCWRPGATWLNPPRCFHGVCAVHGTGGKEWMSSWCPMPWSVANRPSTCLWSAG